MSRSKKKSKGKIVVKGYETSTRKTFTNDHIGVALVKRDPWDNHLCFVFINKGGESANCWVPDALPVQHPEDAGYSSVWINEMISFLTLARKWMQDNCEGDSEYGWELKKGSKYEDR